jgi:hypothetical protein
MQLTFGYLSFSACKDSSVSVRNGVGPSCRVCVEQDCLSICLGFDVMQYKSIRPYLIKKEGTKSPG